MFQHHCNVSTDKYITDTLNNEQIIDGKTKLTANTEACEWYGTRRMV